MSFLYPAFLAAAVAIAIPIVLHLLRRDVAPDVPFSAVRLLRRTPLERTSRRRLRDLLLLAARVAALLLLAGSFARPYLAGSAESVLHIVAIDRSYSMGAPGQFERATALAREAIDAAGAGARVALIAFDERAEVVAGPGAASEARTALAAVKPGHGATRYAPVVARAAELSARAPSRLVIVTDLQRAGWENEDAVGAPAGLEVEVRDAGAPPGNAAVVAVRRVAEAVVASVRNDAARPLAGTARVLTDGRIVASARFTAPGGATVDVRLPYKPPDRGALAVEIDDETGYPADNTRHLLLEPRPRPRVLAAVGDVQQDGFYIARALRSAAGDDALDVHVTSAAALGGALGAEAPHVAAVVLLSTRALDRHARERLAGFVRAGGGLLISAAPDVEPDVLANVMGWQDFSAAERPADGIVLAATDVRHPILRPFGTFAANLGQIRFQRSWRVGADGWDIAARFTDGSPALLDRREGRGRVVLFASDVERRWNDFPLHPAFVPFVLETVRHVMVAADGRGEFLAGAPPPGIPARAGAYTRQPQGRPVVVNVDVGESATARFEVDEFKAMIRPAAGAAAQPAARRGRQVEAAQNLWRYGVLIMLGVLVAESFVGRAGKW